jgi:hypothetical protein
MAGGDRQRMPAAAAQAYALGAMRFDYVLSDSARQIAAALKKVLDATVDLHDAEKRRHHITGPDGCSLENDVDFDPPARVCHLQVQISDRWTLHVYGRPSLHADAEALARWAARKLEAHLPKSTAHDESYPPFGGGGGSSGSAEIGIPLWWARKASG